jgi:hypothetical protein
MDIFAVLYLCSDYLLLRAVLLTTRPTRYVKLYPPYILIHKCYIYVIR